MLQRISGFYEKDVRNTIDAALEMIKPLTMIFLALLVGAVLISVYLPLFDTMTAFGE
jgi:type IV pilus assembly protein PilC